MATEILGVNVLFSIGGTAIGTQRGAKLSVEVGAVDISSKASIWQKLASGRLKGTLTCDGVVSTGSGGSMGLLTTTLAGALVTADITDSVSGDEISGSVLITKWEANFPDQEGTYSVEAQTSGELTYTPG